MTAVNTPQAPALAAAIDALLPQTQCTRCGFAGCRPYAEALAAGASEINRCPPGGTATIAALAQLLHRPELPLDPECGLAGAPRLAWIDAPRCIGCARCLLPCPTDAILGASRLLHTVMAELCTGCELCIAACPVDCIVMRERGAVDGAAPLPEDNRRRHDSHLQRAAHRHELQATLLDERKRALFDDSDSAAGAESDA